MASDSLREVGKTLGKSRRDAERAVKKPFPIKPRLERVRDVFDTNVAFEMEFIKEGPDKQVVLDLYFTLPPPSRGCDVGCIHTRCEEFDFESGGNHYITLNKPYTAGTVSVFVNNIQVSDVNIVQTSPESGEVFYQTNSTGPDTVVVCYINSEDCGIAALCPEFKPSFFGAELLFSDKFDRAESVNTWGGKGGWYDQPFALEPPIISVPIGDLIPNTLSLDTQRQFRFEDTRATGLVQEIMVAFDARTWVNIPDTFAQHPSALSISMVHTTQTTLLTSPNITIKVGGDVVLTYYYAYLPNPWAFNDGSSWAVVNKTSIRHTSLDLRQKLFIRWFYDGDIHRVRIWPQDQPEPSTWLAFDDPLPSFTEIVATINQSVFPPQPITIRQAMWVKPDIWAATMSTTGGNDIVGPVRRISNGALQAVAYWAGQVSGVYGKWEYSANDPPSAWTRNIGHTYAGFYWDPDVETDDLTLSTIFGRIRTTYPTCDVTSGWDTFNPLNGDGHPIGITQTVPSWATTLGKTLDIKITGEVSWSTYRNTLNHPPLTILLQTFHHGYNGPPGTVGDYFFGDTQVTILANHGQWYPFTITIPATADGLIQWGCRFQEETQEITNKLGGYDDNFFFTATSTSSISFRTLWVEAVTHPIGGARPFCPDDING